MRLLPIFVLAASSCTAGAISGPSQGDDHSSFALTLEGQDLADELAASPIHEAPEPFVRIGFLWDADAPDAVEAQWSADGDTWSAWATPTVLHVELEDTASFVGLIETDGAPARFFRLRGTAGRSASYARIELHTTSLSDNVEDRGEDGVAFTMIGNADVHGRAEWDARATGCSSSIGSPYRMAIHHTETPTNDSLSPEARLRQIQSYHMDSNGWCDIGYHYLMSRDGRLWQGRPGNLLGAHAGSGNNAGNIGVSVMGAHDATPITATQLDSIATLVRGLADTHGITLDRTRVKGHREYKSTSCPGDALQAQLDEIVAVANAGGTPPTDPPTDPPPPPEEGGACTLPTDGPWSCGSLTGSTTNPTGNYYTTSFGCWVDEGGTPHTDGGDNCIPACSLASIGCSGMTGPQCERAINWYSADSDRFGCGTKIHVTNPDTGAAAVLMVIDRGPNCSIENNVDYWVLDMSYRASYHLFGGPTSAGEHADVQVVVVDPSTPLGPSTSSGTCSGVDTTPPPDDGVVVQGVLYQGSNTALRIAGAIVTLSDGRQVTTTSVGSWSFAGVPKDSSVTITAAKSGYQTRSITRTASGDPTWASFGLSLGGMMSGTAVLQGVVYTDGNSANRIPGATITLSTGHTITADGNGFYKKTGLPGGAVTITATAPGYGTSSVTRDLVEGTTEWGSVEL